MIRQESTKKAEDTRTAFSAVGTSSTPREATIGRKMHITVLVPKRKASSTRGASVSSTSHSGITMLSSTWLVQKTPEKNSVSSQPGLRSGPGPGTFTLRSSAVRSSWGARGSRPIATALTRKTAVVNHGSACSTWLEWKARAMPPTSDPRVKPTFSAEYM